MDKEIFDGLVESMEQAVAISKLELEPGHAIRIDPVDVKAIRESAGLAQGELARMMRVSVRPLQTGSGEEGIPPDPRMP